MEMKVGKEVWYASVDWEWGKYYKPNPYKVRIISWDFDTVCFLKSWSDRPQFDVPSMLFETQQEAFRLSAERAIVKNQEHGYKVPPECVLPDNQ